MTAADGGGFVFLARCGEATALNHCGSMPALSRTPFHFVISAALWVLSSSGVDERTSAPTLRISARTLAVASRSRIALLVFATIGAGVPDGKASPYQLVTS